MLNPSYTLLFILILTLLFGNSCKEEEDFKGSSAPSSQYVQIPDENFERNLIRQGIDTDSTINQKMLRSDAEKVTHLNLNAVQMSFKVLSLQGIEAFRNLRFLNAAGHKIQKVNLSQNTQLDTLYLYGNLLKQIVLTNNRNLSTLDLTSNQLTSIIGLNNASLLTKLYLSFNELETLSISNSNLEYLGVSHNKLKSLSIRNATALQSLYMPLNELTSIDLSQNVFLKNLVLSANNLSIVDVSQNQDLEYFYISSNLLTQLDVSNNSALIDLRADRNPQLNCIQIDTAQQIPTFKIDSHQSASTNCSY